MVSEIRYRGRWITQAEIESVRKLIAENPTANRRQLSQIVCRAWNWTQANGVLRDMVCRGLLLLLHRQGLIELPPPRAKMTRWEAGRRKTVQRTFLTWDPIETDLSNLRPLEFRQVRRTGEEGLCESLIETYHYLRYVQPVGEHLKYMIYSRGTPVACMAWSSAPRHIGARDRFIGWNQEVRVKVPHLASHILGWMAREMPREWERVYNHPVHLLETFVDTERNKGTCYRAANWNCLGKTTGRGKDDQTMKANRSLKDVWVYPLGRDFREKLCQSPT
ncbi:MAG: Druantia anti-phage system protein DruA [Planctomycetota bacterium]|jgi:hypothetical protein